MNQPINLFEYESLAHNYLTSMAWDYYRSGAVDEITLRNNRLAFERYRLRPRMLRDVSQRDLSVTILGQTLSMPILIAPMAFQCLAHTEGEVATVKAAAAMNTVMILSTLSTKSVDEVAQTQALRWFQLYIHKDRGLTKALIEKAEMAGFRALCLTVDAPFLGRREVDIRNQFTLPEGLILANIAGLKNLEIPEIGEESGLFSYFQQQIDPSITWKDIEWLQSFTRLPVLVKGILRGDDALLAVEHGAEGIIVSNHGGRQLDGAITAVEALPEVVEAVGDKVAVLMDGGIRRGTDVFKAMALGAKAVLLGRPILWGLAVNGEAGVYHVLELLRAELDMAMALSGCSRITDIDASLVTGL